MQRPMTAIRLPIYIYLALLVSGCAGQKEPRTYEEIQAVFDRHRPELYEIYEGFLSAKPDLGGRIVFGLTIEPSGRVSSCNVQESAIDDMAVGTAVCKGILAIDFGRKNTETASMSYPLDFYPR